jgi:uncharacterized Zn-binding protein involved in type VI secretion
MPAICTVGSVDSGHDGFSAGVVVNGLGGLTINGKQAAGTGNISSIHIKPDTPPHLGVVIGTSKLTVNGVPVAMVGSPLGCGAVIVSGESLMQIS